jgi:hypothetical protein
MAVPMRYPSGVSIEKPGHPMADLPIPNPSKLSLYYNDFNTYLASDWTVVAGGAGSGVALSAGVGGVVTLTTATSGTESISGNPSFNFTAGTSAVQGLRTWFESNVTLDATVANPDYAVGLMKGTPGLTSPTDGVWFTKATGATVWSLVIKATAGSTTTIALPASTVPTASQIVDLAFLFDGSKNILYVYFNKALIGTVGTGGSLGTSLANLPASTILCAPAAANVFHTATSTLGLDYITAACETVR